MKMEDCDNRPEAFLPQIIEVECWFSSRYLYPLEKNANQQAEVASQLKELRNNVVFGLLMANAIWILILVQLMTLQVLPNVTVTVSFRFFFSILSYLSFFTTVCRINWNRITLNSDVGIRFMRNQLK